MKRRADNSRPASPAPSEGYEQGGAPTPGSQEEKNHLPKRPSRQLKAPVYDPLIGSARKALEEQRKKILDLSLDLEKLGGKKLLERYRLPSLEILARDFLDSKARLAEEIARVVDALDELETPETLETEVSSATLDPAKQRRVLRQLRRIRTQLRRERLWRELPKLTTG